MITRTVPEATSITGSPFPVGPVVKICGLSDEAGFEAAVAAGADMVGFVFAPSRRRVTPAIAAALVRQLAARTADSGRPLVVGVFVDEAASAVRAIADEVGLDVVQLCGHESPGDARAVGRPVLRAIQRPAWIDSVEFREYREIGATMHVDSAVPGAYGGTGVVADWEFAARLAARLPIILAGGLNAGNVSEAIRRVHPWGVDVSSGVETDGKKDSAKINAFVAAAREAFRAGPSS